MARVFPPLQQIQGFRPAPQSGELHLLEFLDKELNDDYEVYFQPFLNGDRPDIAVMRRGSGVLLIEVKDWDLPAYSVDARGSWHVHSNGSHEKRSPIKQVQAYQDNLFKLHIPQLLERQLAMPELFAIVACAVYFDQADPAQVEMLCGRPKHVELLTRRSLNPEDFRQVLHRARLDRQSQHFDEDLYESFHRFLQPPSHTLANGKAALPFTDKQAALSRSEPKQQKVRGVAGSGKTKVLAHRAVDAYIRTQTRVLILTHNLTLRNYIHDSISEVRADFAWDNFYIINYHQFVKTEANNHSLRFRESKNAFDDVQFFDSVKDEVEKFAAVFIDEIQDFKSEWIRLIKEYFLAEGGEFVVFGDEKQNVYHTSMAEDRRPNTTIPGAWNTLTDSFRSSGRVMNLARAFQARFFRGKYDLDKVDAPRPVGPFSKEQRVRYLAVDGASSEDVFRVIREAMDEWHVHPNDACLLSKETEPLRDLDYLFRTEARERTSTMFACKEQWESLSQSKAFKDLERSKKLHFWMNPGTVKLSTIHSFKGWESDTLILLIHRGGHEGYSSDDELIYTAVTRYRKNLLVVNRGNMRYHDFFSEHCPDA